MQQTLGTVTLIAALSGFGIAAHAQTNVISDNFDSRSLGSFGTTYNYGWSGGAVSSTIVSPGQGGAGKAWQLSGNVTNGMVENAGANSPLYTPSGNTDANLSDYTLSFDLAIAHGANSGLGVSLTIYGGSSFANGSSYTVPINLITVGGGYQHYSVNMGTLANGYEIGALVPTSSQYEFQLAIFGYNASVTATPETIVLDNLQITLTPSVSIINTNTFFGPDGVALHRFSAVSVTGLNLDGANPAAGLVLSGGVLCGTTLNGGVQGAGTAFYVSLDGTNFNAFRTFTNTPDAGFPEAGLAVSGNGFFGTTFAGGVNGVGSVFVAGTNGSSSLIQSFAAVSQDEATNSGGASPSALLALSGNTLYGTTAAGGAAANGTVFSLSTNGSVFSDLHDFSLPDSNTGTNTDGALPCGGVILSGSTLYGTASGGGTGSAGVVFSINTGGGSFAVLHNFTPLDPVSATNADGAFPCSGLILSNGVLYGTTSAGGTGGKGVVFSVGADGSGFAILHNFSVTDPLTKTNLDGASPCAPLALSGSNLYGTASAGGANASGTVFSISTNGAGFQTVYTFTAMNPSTGTNRDGALPVAGVLPLGNSLYGTTFSGGPGGEGTVFGVAIPLPPATITGIIVNPDGSATLSFLGSPNSTNVIQATPVLGPTASWQNISTNTADPITGIWNFTDMTTSQSPIQFYRSYSR